VPDWLKQWALAVTAFTVLSVAGLTVAMVVTPNRGIGLRLRRMAAMIGMPIDVRDAAEVLTEGSPQSVREKIEDLEKSADSGSRPPE
jgi:hypothetical protein